MYKRQVLPLLRRLEQPTEEMLAAMAADTPYFVVQDTNNVWQVRRAADPAADIIESWHGLRRDAMKEFHACERAWRYHNVLRVANEQAIPNPEQPA